jgi:E3 ubiquitin-protein ligase RNF14
MLNLYYSRYLYFY